MIHTYFIGYDAREHEPACIAAYSIRRRSTFPVKIYMIEHSLLRKLDMFWREWRIDAGGQFYDKHDKKPFSTGFSHSRFLVWHLANALKCNGPCMFVDCDWLFLSDPSKLMLEQEKHPDQVGVVSRDRPVEDGSIKMDGMIQAAYPRKLWSALFTFMPSKKWAKLFSPKKVNSRSGRDMHAFLNLKEKRFWEVENAWHYIPSLDDQPTIPKGIHYSEFSPWLNPDRRADSPDEFRVWETERESWLQHQADNPDYVVWDNLELDLLGAKA